MSHSSASSTTTWLEAVGGAGNVQVVVDSEREVYAKWGLGTSGFWHVLSPGGLWEVVRLGREEGIWNRPTESGSRWQMGGCWGVDAQGVVRWGGVAARADEIPDVVEAVKVLESEK